MHWGKTGGVTSWSLPGDAPDAAGRSVRVVSRTWLRDTHGLYDFGAKNIQTSRFVVSEPTTCARRGSDVLMMGRNAAAEESEPLLKVEPKGGAVVVGRASSSSSSKK